MAFEQKEMTFALFENEKEHDRQPDFTGKCKVNGKEYRLACWWSESRSGTRYLSGKISEFKERSAAPSGGAPRRMSDAEFERERERRKKTNPRPAASKFDFPDDDNIPF